MQDVRREIGTFIEENELSQADLARRAGVSQPTVSRALQGRRRRSTLQRRKLLEYIRSRTGQPRGRRYAPGVDQVASAFERIWDGSKAHAQAVANVIDAMDNLRPATLRGRSAKRRSATQTTPKKHRSQ